MRYFLFVILIISGFPAFAQEASYMHDGEYHYYVDGAEVNAPSVLLKDEIMFEHDAKVYLIKNIKVAENTGKKIPGELINDRTKLKGWGIEFYVERDGVLVIYVDGNFHNSDSLFLAAGEAYGYIAPHYFRLNKFKDRKENEFGEIVVVDDGIWWNDEKGDLYALRNGESFKSVPETFSKGYVGQDPDTKEYIWFNRHSKSRAPKVYLMEVIPEAVGINISTGEKFIPKAFYQGKALSEYSIEHDMDEDPSTFEDQSIYFYDNALKKAFWGRIPDHGQTMDLTEIAVPSDKDVMFWLVDNEGQYYMQNNYNMWRVEKESDQGKYVAEHDGRKYELLGGEKAGPMELHPTRIKD